MEQRVHARQKLRGRKGGLGPGGSKVRYSSHAVPGEVLGDFDLDIAEVSLAGGAFALLFVRVVGFGGSGRAAFESAVPVVGDEGFALVALCGAVGVDVVDVREVGSESGCRPSG